MKLGPTDGAYSEVISGLSAGDRVVTDGTDRLRDGQKVTIPTPAKQAAAGQPAAAASARRQVGAVTDRARRRVIA